MPERHRELLALAVCACSLLTGSYETGLSLAPDEICSILAKWSCKATCRHLNPVWAWLYELH